MGNWLTKTGFGGFEVKGLGMTDVGIKTAIELSGKLPSRNLFFSQSGIQPNNWAQLQRAMEDLSRIVGGALEVGYAPKQILAALFIQSTAKPGDERPETSLSTRDMLIKASGNRLSELNQILNRWVRGQ